MTVSEGVHFQTHTVQGYKIRVLDRPGSEAAHPLIICNGIGQSCETIQPFVENVSGRRVISFDAVGVGLSDCAEPFLPMEGHADVLCGLLDQLGIGQADVMGISWGGALAQQFAYAHNDRCRRLVLAITSVGGLMTLTGHPIAMSEIFMPLRRYSKNWTRIITPLMYGGRALTQPDEMARYAKLNVPPDLAGYYGQIAAIYSWSSLGWLNEIRQSTLIYSGRYDPLIPPWNQKILANRIPNARLRTLDTGHWLVYEERERLAREIEEFLG